jgi:hypothetical protein
MNRFHRIGNECFNAWKSKQMAHEPSQCVGQCQVRSSFTDLARCASLLTMKLMVSPELFFYASVKRGSVNVHLKRQSGQTITLPLSTWRIFHLRLHGLHDEYGTKLLTLPTPQT